MYVCWSRAPGTGFDTPALMETISASFMNLFYRKNVNIVYCFSIVLGIGTHTKTTFKFQKSLFFLISYEYKTPCILGNVFCGNERDCDETIKA